MTIDLYIYKYFFFRQISGFWRDLNTQIQKYTFNYKLRTKEDKKGALSAPIKVMIKLSECKKGVFCVMHRRRVFVSICGNMASQL